MTVKHTLVSLDMRVFALCSLMELHRGQATRAGVEAVYPFRSCQRCGHLWVGADDGSVSDCAGYHIYDYERRRFRVGTTDRITAGNRYGG